MTILLDASHYATSVKNEPFGGFCFAEPSLIVLRTISHRMADLDSLRFVKAFDEEQQQGPMPCLFTYVLRS